MSTLTLDGRSEIPLWNTQLDVMHGKRDCEAVLEWGWGPEPEGYSDGTLQWLAFLEAESLLWLWSEGCAAGKGRSEKGSVALNMGRCVQRDAPKPETARMTSLLGPPAGACGDEL